MTDFFFSVGLTDIINFGFDNSLMNKFLWFLLFVIAFFVYKILFITENKTVFVFSRQMNYLLLITFLLMIVYVVLFFYEHQNFSEQKISLINNECTRKCFPLVKKILSFRNNNCLLTGVCIGITDRQVLSFCTKKCFDFEKSIGVLKKN